MAPDKGPLVATHPPRKRAHLTLLSLTAILAVACVPGSVGLAGPSAIRSSAGAASPYATPYTASTYQIDRLLLDVPVGWSIRPAQVNMHYVTVVAFVGSAPSTAGCRSVPPPPGALGSTECSVELNLVPGSVSIELDQDDGPPHLSPLDFIEQLAPGAHLVTVDGVPGVLTVADPAASMGADASVSLELPVPSSVNGRYVLTGYVRGPDTAALLARVEAALTSVRYDPPIAPLPSDPVVRAAVARAALTQLAADQPGYACFPLLLGTSVQATVTELPGIPPASHPLAATCRTELQALPVGLWELDLTAAWGTPGDPTTTATMTDYLLPDGTPDTVAGSSTTLP